jgi:hypothetical protein
MNPHAAAVQIADETDENEKHQTNPTHQSNKISDKQQCEIRTPQPTQLPHQPPTVPSTPRKTLPSNNQQNAHYHTPNPTYPDPSDSPSHQSPSHPQPQTLLSHHLLSLHFRQPRKANKQRHAQTQDREVRGRRSGGSRRKPRGSRRAGHGRRRFRRGVRRWRLL